MAAIGHPGIVDVQPAPDPNGEIPAEGFSSVQWLGYQLFAEEKTTAVVADSCQRALSTVTNWKRQWRERYGTHLFRHRKPGENVTGRGGPKGGLAEKQRWAELREAAAPAFGQTAIDANAIAQAIIAEWVQPDRIKELGPRDAYFLIRTAEKAAALADRLDNIADPNRGRTGQGPTGERGGVPKGILGGLDTRNSSGRPAGILARLDVIKVSFEARMAAAAEEPIETTVNES